MRKNLSLYQAVLASTLLMAPGVYADTTVIGVNDCGAGPGTCVPPLATTVYENIRITALGQLNSAADFTDGITIDDANRTITIDPNNSTAGNDAIIMTGFGAMAIHATPDGDNAEIIIQADSNVEATGTDSLGIFIDGASFVTITNEGKIFGEQRGIQGGGSLVIENQAGGSILSTLDGIAIDDSGDLSLSNAGKIEAAIGIVATNFNNITNLAGATITGNGPFLFPIAGIAVLGTNPFVGTAIIENYGTINSLDNAAVFLGGYIGSINNYSTGIITSTSTAGTHAAIIFNGFDTFNNDGLVSAPNEAGIIQGMGATTGTINNNVTGKISGERAAIELLGGLLKINNAGTLISETGNGTIFAATAGITIAGGIINSGNITNETVGGNAINLAIAGVAPITQNNGTITGNILTSGAGGAVLTMNGGTIDGNIVGENNPNTFVFNNGTVTGKLTLGDGGDTVTLAGATIQAVMGGAGADTYNVSAGSMTTLTDNGGSNKLNLSGGIISGPITFSSATNTLNLSGGQTSVINLSGGTNTINLSGTNVQVFNSTGAGDVYNVSGGSFTALNGAANETLNVLATFTANGTISGIDTINVDAGTFTVNQAITGLDTQLTIDANAAMVMNANVSGLGTADNSGTLRINSPFILSMSQYTQENGSAFVVQLQDVSNYGKIQTLALPDTLKAGSTINPILGTGFIPDNATFDVITAAVPVTDASTLVQPNSPVIFFTKQANQGGNNVRLTAHLRSFAGIAGGTSEVGQAVGSAIDSLVPLAPNINPDLLNLLLQLELLPTQDAVTRALEKLAPPYNYALVQSAHESMDTAFDSVQVRLQDLQIDYPPSKKRKKSNAKQGQNLGDLNRIFGGREYNAAWVKGYALYANQDNRDNTIALSVPGYRLQGEGVALGADWQIMPCGVLGIAASYLHENAHDKLPSRNTIKSDSYQATLYGWVEPIQNIYIDSMMGVALHDYDSSRLISIGSYVANPEASFLGLQFGAQADVGYVAPIENDFYIAPFVRFKYTYLGVENYQETGSSGANLNVHNHGVNEAIGGLGLRFALREEIEDVVTVPQLWLTALYDFAGQPQEMISNFLGGGIPFTVNSVDPRPGIFLISLSVDAYFSKQTLLTVKYNLELRDQFVGNDAYIMLNYTWD